MSEPPLMLVGLQGVPAIFDMSVSGAPGHLHQDICGLRRDLKNVEPWHEN